MNTITIIGRLGNDADVKCTKTGVSVSHFSVCVEDYAREDVDWINCTQFANENVIPYLTKGKQVAVSGRLKVDPYEINGEKRINHYILVDRVELLGSSTKTNSTGLESNNKEKAGSISLSVPQKKTNKKPGNKKINKPKIPKNISSK